MNIPEDLILDVLSRLSVKNLIRLQCVSKEWLGLISSPSLKKVRDLDVAGRNPNHHKFVVVWHYSYPSNQSLTLYVIDLLDGKLQSEFKLTSCYNACLSISGSCHGLIYFCDWQTKEIYVCNPSTHVLVKLTKPPSASFMAPGNVRIGMGYLPESNTYKIVVWNRCFGQYPVMGFDIFTLKDGDKKPKSSRWRTLEKEKNPDFDGEPGDPNSLSLNGVIYWMHDQTNWYRASELIVAFDLRTEEYKIIRPPPFHSSCNRNTNIAELRGSLCVAEWINNESKKTIIWVLRDQDNGWVQQYNIPLYIGHLLTYTIICEPNKQEEEDLDLVFMEKGQGSLNLRYYNTRNKFISARLEPSLVTGTINHRSFVYFDTLFNPGTSRKKKKHASRRRRRKNKQDGP